MLAVQNFQVEVNEATLRHSLSIKKKQKMLSLSLFLSVFQSTYQGFTQSHKHQ